MKLKKQVTTAIRGLVIIALVLLTVCYGTLSISAESFSWYCMRKKDHSQPSAEPNMAFIEEYDGFFIDKRAVSSTDKIIYLTFDAGYENGNIEKILDVLKAENVSAAFFVLGHLIKSNTELVKRMAEEGHLICNHTVNHKDMSKISDIESFKRELEALEDLCLEKTGYQMSKYYRPPEGKFSKESLEYASRLGYKTIFWSFAYADWDNQKQMSESSAKKTILSNIHNGEIMLLHPTSATNAAIIGDIIRELKAQGFSFGTLESLTENASEN